MNGFQRDVIKAAKAMAYAHRAFDSLDKGDEDFQFAVIAVSNCLLNLNDAVYDLEDYEDRKKKGAN